MPSSRCCQPGLTHHAISRGTQVGIPYLRSKADDLYETLGGGAETELFDDRPSGNTELVERRVSRCFASCCQQGQTAERYKPGLS